MKSTRHMFTALALLFTFVWIGTFGYYFIEGWSLFESLYMTVITISTVGFEEVHPMSDQGRTFTIIMIMMGAGIIAYTVGSVIQFMVEGQLARSLGRRKMNKKIKKIKDHYIVCGYGRIGAYICREFSERNVPFVIVESCDDTCEYLEDRDYLLVNGSATKEETLRQAGIENAKGLITVVGDDTVNVFITLTARGMNKELFILSRAAAEETVSKLNHAGATRVISPYMIGAERMLHAVLRPGVLDFIETAMTKQNLDVVMEEVVVTSSSDVVEKTILESDLKRQFGVIILAIHKMNGDSIFNPDPETILEAGDTMIVVGTKESTETLSDNIHGLTAK